MHILESIDLKNETYKEIKFIFFFSYMTIP